MFNSESRGRTVFKNLMRVLLSCMFALEATAAHAACFGSFNEQRCRDVEKASEKARKDTETWKADYVKNGGKLTDTSGPTKATTTKSK